MRRLTAVVACGLLLGGVIVASPAAWAHPGHDHGEARGLDDFNLTGEFTDFQKDDQGEEGPSEGDTFAVKMDLVDEHGDAAGDGEGTCEATEVDRDAHEFTADCESVFHLDDGDLEMAGEVTEEDFKDKEIVLDITGGTDAYEGASGTVTFTPAEGHGDGHGHGEGGHGEEGHGGGEGGGHTHGAGPRHAGPEGDGGQAGDHKDGHGKDGHHKVDIAVDFD